jgi:hypothetical protein
LYARVTYDLRDLASEDGEEWAWVDYRIKPLIAHRTLYLELED